eukprot:scaffold42481_cov81-Attheya_sp.AAC.1
MVEEANCDHSKLRPQLCTERKIHPRVPFETSQVRSGDCEVSGARDTQRVRSRLSKTVQNPMHGQCTAQLFSRLSGKKSVFEDYHPGTYYGDIVYNNLLIHNLEVPAAVTKGWIAEQMEAGTHRGSISNLLYSSTEERRRDNW